VHTCVETDTSTQRASERERGWGGVGKKREERERARTPLSYNENFRSNPPVTHLAKKTFLPSQPTPAPSL